MKKIILSLLLASAGFSDLARADSRLDVLCQTPEIMQRYQLELNRTWWVEGLKDSGYTKMSIEAPAHSYLENGELGCTSVIVLTNPTTNAKQELFSGFKVKEVRNRKIVTLRAVSTMSPFEAGN
ncbi:hypothetical protein F9883_18720 [Morganella morganii]|uniref:hypothetical protein n=1 Tax=Morganella morganii TaxID=582 RepID=UPI0015F3E246|nr:hypothetical protein [Morganella morganii]MBA5809893.1 hypothetical protein [Morganella morganii]